MKRYALFTYAYYYPEGGWHDFVDSFESVDLATNSSHITKLRDAGWDVVDLTSGTIVAAGNVDYSGAISPAVVENGSISF